MLKRFGVADFIASQVNESKIDHTDISWHFQNANINQIKMAKLAFETWSNVTPTLTFKHEFNNSADILIALTPAVHLNRKNENCGWDLGDGTLAHAITVTNQEYPNSQIHILLSLPITENYPDFESGNGYSLYHLLVHEIGHALGIPHIFGDTKRVMHPIYHDDWDGKISKTEINILKNKYPTTRL